ncbi:tRNA-binding protein [Pseudonocardia spinosispora]|uniref:tRNA-binding protein n=1 Tax=Pseudonocardia spinosispora TaxID=103441 RepID=UPI0004029120|nr:tRNA-binding protein [Pseudonocardia spinosispora]
MSTAAKEQTTPEAFFSVDMRVGRVTDVREFPEARRPAWKVTVDFGDIGELQTSAQITNYTREQLIGRLVVGAVNLGAKRIAGFRSEFLLLGGCTADGTVHLLAPDAGTPGDPVA